ncbi:MAG: helix-turn-helix domain-containing protein [Coriobacteriia bacterium]
MNTKEDEIDVSSGNVFEDLGLPQPDEALAKADLAIQIRSIASHRHLTQAETARLLGTTQLKISDLFAGKLAGFSLERLIKYLMLLNRDVTLVVTPKSQSSRRATLRVVKRDNLKVESNHRSCKNAIL